MDTIRKFFASKVGSADPELGASDPQTGGYSVEAPRVLHSNDKLAMFRFLTGITSDASLNVRTMKGRAGENYGIYPRVVKNEMESAKKFKTYSFLINFCLGLQIIVAATLTALGAANGSNAAVTVFGAINTVIAGFLTFLKGSGLPNRIRFYENEWKRLREYMEQRERDFGTDACTLDVFKTIAYIEYMYQEVVSDIEVNTPESYISSRQKSPPPNELNESTFGGLTSPVANEKLQALEARAQAEGKAFSYQVGKKAKEAARDVTQYEEDTMESAQRGVRDFADDRISQVFVNAPDDLGPSSQFNSTTDTLRPDTRPSDT